ncbi:hypothetical protein [Streptomyces endophyticus]|uniref:Uncharacterized protein n=1 Tax=Streptomyces endophyticus TaxID=714166 RepID=A0ABU6EXX6_9ACTN|nr:hypothetical protein [Streptomyces endophyticus]MEB8336454.1 hypothetical protein [Streptomyces endophyticus]
MQLRHKSLLSAAFVTLALAAPARADAPSEPAPETGGWQQVGEDATSGVSGLALTGEAAADGTEALVVHDNKKPGQPRISRVTFHQSAPKDTTVTPVAWEGPVPKDLEAIEAVPGTHGEFMALASRGLVYRLQVAGDTARVLDLAPLPAIPEGADFESFALGTSASGRTVAVWADRGAGADRPATVFAAPFSISEYGEAEFGNVSQTNFRAAYPKGDVRHVSDISLTKSGRITVSSASDAGDDGPFASSVSEAGRVSLNASGTRATLRIAVPRTTSEKFDGRKIEAVECVPGADGTALLGTDDENLGGYVKSARVCAG